MSALTKDFDSYIKNQRAQNEYTIAGSSAVYVGGLAQLNSAGTYVAPAASGTSYKIVGQFVKGAVAATTSDTVVPVREGDIFLNLSANTPPTAANIGAVVYADSDNEVTTLSSGRAKVGILIALENGGAVVRCTQECN
jgi:hypothetical protein